MINKNISKKIQILLNQFKTRNYEIVISKGNILLKENPEYVVLYNLVGSAYQNTGNYINAKNNFKNGLKLDPNNLALLNNLAMSHKNLLQYQLAEELYFKIIELNKNYVNAYVNLGNLKRDMNRLTCIAPKGPVGPARVVVERNGRKKAQVLMAHCEMFN